jgi:hypothetical protein
LSRALRTGPVFRPPSFPLPQSRKADISALEF